MSWAALKPWIFPVTVVVLVLVLTGLGWSGSSIGVLEPNGQHVIAGTPRGLRSDEWSVATPLIVAASHHGYSATSQASIGSHNMGVLLDVPTKTWPTIFRPWDYGFFVLGVTRGFAFRWWTLSAVLLLGAYGLILQLARKVGAAAAFAIALWASPFFHWWYLDLSFVSAGMAMAALAAFLAALDRRAGLGRNLLLLGCAYTLVSFVLVLYPPFQIPAAMVMIFVGVGDLLGRHRSCPGILRTAGRCLGVVLAGSLFVVAAYYLANRAAIHLINGTVYPGRRQGTGGNPDLYQLLSAPYGWAIAAHGDSLTFSNQSEISSFIPVAPFVCLQLLRLRFSALAPRARGHVAGALAALALLSVWFFIGLPGPIAALTGLDWVPGFRVIGGIGLAGLVLVAVFSTGLEVRDHHRGVRSFRAGTVDSAVAVGALTAATVAFGVTYLTGSLLESASPGLGIGSHTKLIAALAMGAVTFLLSAGFAVLGGCLLAIFGLIVSLPANPLYSGLAPLTSDAVTGVFRSVPGSAGARWLSFTGPQVADELIASGLPTINGVSFYPDPAAWQVLDPTGSERHVWDRYARISFAAQPALLTPKLDLLGPDEIKITIDPCGSQLPRLGVHFAVSDSPMLEPCLTLVRTSTLLGMRVFIYRL